MSGGTTDNKKQVRSAVAWVLVLLLSAAEVAFTWYIVQPK